MTREVDGSMQSRKTLPIQEIVSIVCTPFRRKLEDVSDASFRTRVAHLSSTSEVLSGSSVCFLF